jgi:hypothetical protein
VLCCADFGCAVAGRPPRGRPAVTSCPRLGISRLTTATGPPVSAAGLCKSSGTPGAAFVSCGGGRLATSPRCFGGCEVLPARAVLLLARVCSAQAGGWAAIGLEQPWRPALEFVGREVAGGSNSVDRGGRVPPICRLWRAGRCAGDPQFGAVPGSGPAF